MPKLSEANNAAGVSAYPATQNVANNTASSLNFKLSKGQSARESIVVVNDASIAQTITLYPVDAVATSEGGLAMRNQGEARSGVGAWIHLASSHIYLEPHTHKAVALTMIIPSDASSGDHAGGIIIQPESTRSIGNEQNIQLQVISRFALRVYETVPGIRLSRIDLTRFICRAQDKLTVDLTIVNSGNATEWPRGTIAITGQGSAKAEIVDLPPLMLLPHQSAQLRLSSTAKQPLIWRYIAHLELHFNNQVIRRDQTVVWYSASALYTGIFIAMSLLIYRLRRIIMTLITKLINI